MNERTRLPFFPLPTDGETVFSVIGRCAERLGIADRELMTILTEQRYTKTLFAALPGYLQKISAVMPIGHPWRDVNVIVQNHTTLPYFSYFHPRQKRLLSVRTLAAANSSQPIALAMGLSMYRTAAATSNPRFCMTCIREHAMNSGFAYFHLAHQLPGVFVCWKHDEILSNGCVHCGLYPLTGKKLSMPGQCLCRSFQARPISKILITRGGKWLATASAYLLKSPTSEKDPIERLRKKVIEAGLCRGSLIDYSLLAEKIEARFGSELLKSIGYSAFNAGRPSAWLRRFFSYRTEMRQLPTIGGLLISGAALTNIEDFEQGESAAVRVTHDVPFLQDTSQKDGWKAGLSRELMACSFRISSCAAALGQTPWAVALEARDQGLTVPLSRLAVKRLGSDRLKKIKQQLRTGVQKKQILKEHQLGEWTLLLIELSAPKLCDARRVNLTNANIQKHRKILIDYIRKNPNANRSNVIEQRPGTYDFLIRQDKIWFQGRIPKAIRTGTTTRSPRYNPKNRDKLLASRLLETAENMLRTDQKPKQVTMSTLLLQHGALGRYSAKKADFPISTQALQEVIESSDEFMFRKITWAIKDLISRGQEISLENLRRKANITPSRLRPHFVRIRYIVSTFGGTVSKKSKLAQ